MSIDLRTQSELKRILLNSNGNGKNKPEPQELGEEENIQVVAPEAKEVTASIQDVLASYNQSRVSFVPKASGNIPIPEGVSTRDVDGNTVTTFRQNDRIQTQIYGSDFDARAIIDRFVLKDIKYVLPQEPESTEESNGVNGEIDEKVGQGGTGDCWLLTGVLALNSTDIGKKIIKTLTRLGITDAEDIKAVAKANPKAFANKYFRVDVNDVYIPKEVIANMKANGTYDEDKLMGKTV